MIAPTKKPSSRLKITPQAAQRSWTLNGSPTIDALPQAGHVSLRHRHRVRRIVRGSLFMAQCPTNFKVCRLPCFEIELHLPGLQRQTEVCRTISLAQRRVLEQAE